MSDPLAHAREIFAVEAQERLDRMVELLLEAEAGQAAADHTDALFREAHSLKGAAGLVGLEELRELSHAVEELLSDLRGNGAALPPDLVEPLLKAVDQMRRAVEGKPVQLDPPPRAEDPAQPPTASIRVPARKVDRLLDTVGEAVLHERALGHLLERSHDERVQEALDRGELLVDELQHSALDLRALPLATIVGPYPRHVRDLAAVEGKQVTLEMSGVDTQLDRAILEGISEPLLHVLRNAVAHGIESPERRREAGKPARGTIELRAEQRGGFVALEIADDGAGVSPELLREAAGGSLIDLLARPGFSTADRVSDVAGRGVGLDAVKSHVESLGGSLEASSEPGRGTTITALLPLSLSILHVLLVERDGGVFALPIANVTEVMAGAPVLSLEGRQSIEREGALFPVADLAAVLRAPSAAELDPRSPTLLVTHAGTSVALRCDRLRGEEEVIVKGLGPVLSGVSGYLGAAILADGRMALVVDPAVALARGEAARGAAPAPGPQQEARSEETSKKVLVVDDQLTIRELQRSILEAAGYRVSTATDGRDALDQLTATAGDVGIVVTDLQMPEMDGLELLRRVREEPSLASLPVVVVTSLGSEEDRRRGLEAGADAYVVKDRFDQRVLLETVEGLLGR